jgi:molybdenum cofactor cytidylyltransferase
VVNAIVLAAGESTRMGSPKALLASPDGLPFVARIVSAFHDAKVEDVTVVTGRDHAAIAEALARAALVARLVRNHDPSRGQLSSLWTGMDAAITDTTAAILVTLVDVPMLSGATVAAVIETWQRQRPLIVRPAIGDRHGHPVLFDRRLFDELRRAPLDAGAKVVVRRHADAIVNVAVADEGCLVDIDTPQEYRNLSTRSLAKPRRP